MKKALSIIFLDTIPVIFGVLIALFIGDWKREQDDTKYMNKMIGVMKEEARDNFNDFDQIIPTHIRMIDTIDYYLQDEEVSIMLLFAKNKGFKLPSVNNRTWTAVINNRIELVDIETLKIVNDIDEFKEVTAKKTDILTAFIYANMNEVSSESKETMRLHFLNLIETEFQLFQIHAEFIDIDSIESPWIADYGIEL